MAIENNGERSSQSKPLVCVVGLGEMGLVHATNLACERRVLLGLCSARDEVLSSTASKLCADRTYSTYEEVLSDAEVSGVVIASAVDSHAAMIAQAARAGKHILSEKPLGSSVGALGEMYRAVSSANVRFMVAFQRRWDLAYADAKSKVRKGELGGPIVLKCTSGDPEYPEKYRRVAAKNALLTDLAVHDIDLARWLLQSEVQSAYATTEALTYPDLVERGDADVAIVVLHMTSGAKAVMHLSRALAYGYNVTTELVGKEGTVQIGELKGIDNVVVKGCAVKTDINWDFMQRFRDAFRSEMSAFVDLVCMEGDEDAAKLMKEHDSYAGLEDGFAATLIAEALVESSQKGVPVAVASLRDSLPTLN